MPDDARENADRGQGDEDRSEASHEPRECMACRGTGQVISNLGGTASKVSCPWCRGSGTRIAGIDAQARWLEDESKGSPTGSPSEPAA
jgi:DnaJ-class molecular chaperone